MTDWQEVYFDAVNKVETETMQQGDLVPIWNAFKAMSQEINRLREALKSIEVSVMEAYNQWSEEGGCDGRDAIRLAFKLGEDARAALGETE